MSKFVFQKMLFSGLFCVNNFAYKDNRGWFVKFFEKDTYKNECIDFEIAETFVTVSAKNVIRALHFQLDKPQTKLISVVQGKIWCVVVDLRPHSMTYKQWISIELSSDNHKALYIPKGFALGYVSQADNSIVLYQCEGAFDPASDTGISYNDPTLNIKWPVAEGDLICSEKDRSLMSFEEYNANPMQV